jgi:hypothetical protein
MDVRWQIIYPVDGNMYPRASSRSHVVTGGYASAEKLGRFAVGSCGA